MTNHPRVEKLPHHEQLEFCYTRAIYRQGKKLTSVKSYTVNDESKYLIVSDVPAIKIQEEVERLCLRYGDIESFEMIPDYPQEEYAEAYLVKFRNIKCARFAKNKIDGKSFYGGVLHVCYAPELESIEDTREKLADRRKSIAALTRYKTNACEINKTKQISNRLSKVSATQKYLSKLKVDTALSFTKYTPPASVESQVSIDNVTAESDFKELNFNGLAPSASFGFDVSNARNNLELAEIPNLQNSNSDEPKTRSDMGIHGSWGNMGPEYNTQYMNNYSAVSTLHIDGAPISVQSKKRGVVSSSDTHNIKKIKLFKNIKILSYNSKKDNT